MPRFLGSPLAHQGLLGEDELILPTHRPRVNVDAFQEEAHRRAVQGIEKPVYQGGRLVGTVREYSDTLLIFLLKGLRPERYKERVYIDIEDRVRQVAKDLGLDPNEAVSEAQRILNNRPALRFVLTPGTLPFIGVYT